ncbi:MAG: class I SAM-dependent methyltransferase [Gemmatimonadota bacterium]
MRPYTRSLHDADYLFLQRYVDPIATFQRGMTTNGVPHREWHPHRFWEYASVMQQLTELNVPNDAEIIDVGAGASFFDPYLATLYPRLCCTDTEKYGDYSWMVAAQRTFYNVALPLFDSSVEDMPAEWSDKFDVTLCISTVEHVDDHDKGFAELVRITKPGGLIMITSDYFRDLVQFEQSISRHLQVTPYREVFVLDLPNRFEVDFVGETDLGYAGDFVHNYSFCNICFRKRGA